MGNNIPLTSFELKQEGGKLVVLLDGQPLNMHLLQKVEVVIDAQLQQPFVRLTAVAGDTGVKLGNTVLELKPGDPHKPTFENVPRGPAYHGHGCVTEADDGPRDASEHDPNHGHEGSVFNDGPAS